MKKEPTKRRKRRPKKEQHNPPIMLAGGLGIILFILIISLSVFLFGSCSTDYAKAETNTVYILGNGKVVSTDIEPFDEKLYDLDELKSYIKASINTYNSENGRNSLKQKSFRVKEGEVVLVLQYANTNVFETVNGVELFAGTIEEAKGAGYKFDADFAKMTNDRAIVATADDFATSDDYKVVIIKSNTKVVVPGEICYVSMQNIAEIGEDYVVIKNGSKLLAEEENTEFGSEAEGSDGSISEDELANSDGNIIFDFGEEEESASQYSEVLTYIIYK